MLPIAFEQRADRGDLDACGLYKYIIPPNIFFSTNTSIFQQFIQLFLYKSVSKLLPPWNIERYGTYGTMTGLGNEPPLLTEVVQLPCNIVQYRKIKQVKYQHNMYKDEIATISDKTSATAIASCIEWEKFSEPTNLGMDACSVRSAAWQPVTSATAISTCDPSFTP